MLSFYTSTLLFRIAGRMSAMDNEQTMSARLTAVREERGLSRPQLAKLIGVTRAAVNQWEDGSVANIRPPNLLKLCDVLGIEVRWLVYGEGPKYAEKSVAARKREDRWLNIAKSLDADKGDELLAYLESRIALERAGLLPVLAEPENEIH